MPNQARVFESFWVNGSIRCALSDDTFQQFPFILITSIDSDVELRNGMVLDQIRALDSTAQVFGEGMIVSGASLRRTDQVATLFTGFDEIWCFHAMPDKPKPQNLSIVGPHDVRSDNIPPEHLKWLDVTGCIAGLGDGIGLNVVTSDRVLATKIKHLFA